MDHQVEVTADGRRIRFCNVVDEFPREALATTAARSFPADDTGILLDNNAHDHLGQHRMRWAIKVQAVHPERFWAREGLSGAPPTRGRPHRRGPLTAVRQPGVLVDLIEESEAVSALEAGPGRREGVVSDFARLDPLGRPPRPRRCGTEGWKGPPAREAAVHGVSGSLARTGRA